jgi:hypothetical protein
VTPKAFKARYNDIKVQRTNGTVETVRVNRYVLNNSQYFNATALAAFRQQFFSRGIDRDLTIFTNSGEVKVQLELTKAEKSWEKRGVPMRFEIDNKQGQTSISTHDVDWGGFAVYCFLGKGAPEHYQIVLQLADHWGLAPNGLQAYADSALGLDCNGFVGNYIWHGKKGKPWSKPGFKDLKGPDSIITNFFTGSTFVKRWEDIHTSNTYVLGMVNKAGQIVPGGNGIQSAGHIMITQPGESSPGHFDTYSPRLWVVESTAGAVRPGLTEGWYACLEYDQKTGVFTFDRGTDIQLGHREIRCKIVPLT